MGTDTTDGYRLTEFVLREGLTVEDLHRAFRSAGLSQFVRRHCSCLRHATDEEVREFGFQGPTQVFLWEGSGECFVSLIPSKRGGSHPTLWVATMRSVREIARNRASLRTPAPPSSYRRSPGRPRKQPLVDPEDRADESSEFLEPPDPDDLATF